MNKLAEATEVTAAVTRQAPEVLLGWYNLGLIQRKAGNIGGAIEAYENGLQLDPDSPELHQNLGAARLAGGNFEAARESFLMAIGLLLQQNRKADAEALARSAGELVNLNAA